LYVNFYTDKEGGTLASVSGDWSVSGNLATLAKLTLNIDLADFKPSTGADGENIFSLSGTPLYNDRIIAHEMTHAIMADAMGDDFLICQLGLKKVLQNLYQVQMKDYLATV
jgi:flagellin